MQTETTVARAASSGVVISGIASSPRTRICKQEMSVDHRPTIMMKGARIKNSRFAQRGTDQLAKARDRVYPLKQNDYESGNKIR
jgi:hypothetical protein